MNVTQITNQKSIKAKGVWKDLKYTFPSSKTRTRKEKQDAPQPKHSVEKKLFESKHSNNLNNHAQGWRRPVLKEGSLKYDDDFDDLPQIVEI